MNLCTEPVEPQGEPAADEAGVAEEQYPGAIVDPQLVLQASHELHGPPSIGFDVGFRFRSSVSRIADPPLTTSQWLRIGSVEVPCSCQGVNEERETEGRFPHAASAQI